MNKPEGKLQQKCMDYLTDEDIYYINQYGNGRTAKGAPDLIVCLNGRFLAFELKVGTNDMQDDQIIHQRRIVRNKGLHFTPRTIDEFKEIVNELREG